MGCQCIGMGITVKMSFEGKNQQEIGKWTNIDYSEKENGPRASSAPALGLNTIIFKHVYWYIQQISGERLQDHLSSGLALHLVQFDHSPFAQLPSSIVQAKVLLHGAHTHFFWISTMSVQTQRELHMYQKNLSLPEPKAHR